MSIFDAAVHSGMHDDMRRNVLALIARVTTIEDALQIKPREPEPTPERCHIGGCVNPLPPYIFPFCAKCGLPTCTAHVYEHPAPLEDDADNTAGWCKTCHDTATQPEPVQRAYVMIADECGVTECTTRVEPDESNQCNHCGKPTCWAHKNHPDVMYCDDCWNGMRDTPTIPALVPDDGPSTCYICGIDHDLDDVATCTTCNRTVCFDHSVNVKVGIERFFNERNCKACGYGTVDEELVASLTEGEHLRTANNDLQASCTDTRNRLESETNMHLCARWQLEYADDAIDELYCQLLDAQQEHTKTMRLLSRLTTRAKNRLNSIGTIVDLETIDLSTPESEEE